jgi:hypothetical protein
MTFSPARGNHSSAQVSREHFICRDNRTRFFNALKRVDIPAYFLPFPRKTPDLEKRVRAVVADG